MPHFNFNTGLKKNSKYYPRRTYKRKKQTMVLRSPEIAKKAQVEVFYFIKRNNARGHTISIAEIRHFSKLRGYTPQEHGYALQELKKKNLVGWMGPERGWITKA